MDKTTLMKAVWPNVVIEENNLNQAISAVVSRAWTEGRPPHPSYTRLGTARAWPEPAEK
jgi:hypothetical protein